MRGGAGPWGSVEPHFILLIKAVSPSVLTTPLLSTTPSRRIGSMNVYFSAFLASGPDEDEK
jgi:hypothetical protein